MRGEMRLVIEVDTREVVFYWQLALDSATRCSRVAITACNKQLPAPSHHNRCAIVCQAVYGNF